MQRSVRPAHYAIVSKKNSTFRERITRGKYALNLALSSYCKCHTIDGRENAHLRTYHTFGEKGCGGILPPQLPL
nr:MAG TPA: hypothetical protein [Caudoviricetes sp.]DAY17670.1 MAG TPA: hypothetical protein [Caudoviricetes sp.]DAY97549.1 MAG TPA: hypothetical protein [Caudoviricetes sp.]